jgi:hypothetical protein
MKEMLMPYKNILRLIAMVSFLPNLLALHLGLFPLQLTIFIIHILAFGSMFVVGWDTKELK